MHFHAGRILEPVSAGVLFHTIEVDGRKMRVDALDGLRVAKVWLSRPSVGAQPPERVRDDDH